MRILPSGRVPFNWNVSPESRKKFDEICEAKGYQKQAQVERMLINWIAAESPPGEAHDFKKPDRSTEGSGAGDRDSGKGTLGDGPTEVREKKRRHAS